MREQGRCRCRRSAERDVLAAAVLPAQVPGDPRRVRGQRLGGRTVDERAAPRSPGREGRRPSAASAAVWPTAHSSIAIGRRTGPRRSHQQRPGESLDDEVAPGVARVRTGRAEAGDGHDRRRRLAGEQLVPVRSPSPAARRARSLDDQVGAGEQRPQDAAAAARTSMTTLRLLVFRWANAPRSERSRSPPGGSTLTTSAPRSAKAFPHQLAATPLPISTTRTSLNA